MNLPKAQLLYENKFQILENIKQAKQYISQGKLTQEELKKFVEIDPSPTRKYVGWMAKQFVLRNVPDIDELRNTIEEFHTFSEAGKSKTKDIYRIKTFKELKDEVDELNKTGASISVKDLENDYDTIIDNSDLLIMSPHTHEASRKLGLSHFAYRDCGNGKKDSSWCTTYKAPNHFNDYYYKHNVTFYYIKVRSKSMMNQLKDEFRTKWKNFTVVALAVLEDNKIDGYDGLDRRMGKSQIDKFTNIIGIS